MSRPSSRFALCCADSRLVLAQGRGSIEADWQPASTQGTKTNRWRSPQQENVNAILAVEVDGYSAQSVFVYL